MSHDDEKKTPLSRGPYKKRISKQQAETSAQLSKRHSGIRLKPGFFNALKNKMKGANTLAEFNEYASAMLLFTPEEANNSNCVLLEKFVLIFFYESFQKMYVGKICSVSAGFVIIAFDDGDYITLSHFDARCALCYDKVIPIEDKLKIEDNIRCLQQDDMVLTLKKGTTEEGQNMLKKRRKIRLDH